MSAVAANQAFDYRGFKIVILPATLTVEAARCVATKGRKKFEGRLGDVTTSIDAYLA